MARSKEMDLTTGNPFWSLLKFAIPVILGNLFQLFYTLADSVIVGKTLGANSLAAVGSTSIIIYFVFCFINGFTGGFGICLGQKCGAKDEKGMRKSVAVSTLLSIAFTVVLTLICCLLARQILVWMQIPSDISGEAYDYMFVVLLGTGATVFYNHSVTVPLSSSESDCRTEKISDSASSQRRFFRPERCSNPAFKDRFSNGIPDVRYVYRTACHADSCKLTWYCGSRRIYCSIQSRSGFCFDKQCNDDSDFQLCSPEFRSRQKRPYPSGCTCLPDPDRNIQPDHVHRNSASSSSDCKNVPYRSDKGDLPLLRYVPDCCCSMLLHTGITCSIPHFHSEHAEWTRTVYSMYDRTGNANCSNCRTFRSDWLHIRMHCQPNGMDRSLLTVDSGLL